MKDVSQFRKEDKKGERGLTVYAYQGVGQCNELFFFGSLAQRFIRKEAEKREEQKGSNAQDNNQGIL